MVVMAMPGVRRGATCGVANGSADCELRRSKKTARNEGWRRYSGNNSPSSGSSDNRYFRPGCY